MQKQPPLIWLAIISQNNITQNEKQFWNLE